MAESITTPEGEILLPEMELFFLKLIKSTIQGQNKGNIGAAPNVEQYSKAIADAFRQASKIARAEFARSIQTQESGKIDQVLRNFVFTSGKKKISSNLVWQVIESSWIRAAGYDYQKKILYIAFKKASNVGKLCDLFAYYNIEEEQYVAILGSVRVPLLAIKKNNNQEGVSFDRVGMFSNNTSLINYKTPRVDKNGVEIENPKFAFNQRIKEIDSFFATNSNKIDYRQKLKNAYANSYERAKDHLELSELFLNEKESEDSRIKRLRIEIEKKLKDYYNNDVRKIITASNLLQKGILSVAYGGADALLDYFKDKKNYIQWKE